MTKAYRMFSTRQTPQSQPIPGSNQIVNLAGGYTWEIDDWQRLDRFLVLGSEGGTYYVGEQELTRQSGEATLRCIKENGQRVVARIVEISETGRAPKNEAALFALAMALKLGDLTTRKAAAEALPRVARIGTHLFHFCAYLEQFGGWGRTSRAAIANWYNGKDVNALAYQVAKYPQRDGWSHRDALRLSHPIPTSEQHNLLYRHIVGKEVTNEKLPAIIEAMLRAQMADEKAIVRLIRYSGLTREMLPTECLNSTAVWEALLESMPLAAMIRNLGKMTSIGLIKPMSLAAGKVIAELGNTVKLQGARIHPIHILAAIMTYKAGRGYRGSLSWSPVSQVVDALDRAFYASFGNIVTTGKRYCFGLDVSGSMAGSPVNGIPFLSCREACGAMALVSAACEPNNLFVAFDTNTHNLVISPRQRLDDVVNILRYTGGGGTDCAIPITYAYREQIPIDMFVILTDSETWQGRIHPAQALQEYRQKMGLSAKMAVVAMAATRTTIADPQDAGQINFVGFDTATPQLISDFAVA